MNTLGYDDLIERIARYAVEDIEFSAAALNSAHQCTLDAVACALLAYQNDECRDFIATKMHGRVSEAGLSVLGSIQKASASDAAFVMGACIRWLDFNDTWLAEEWGHPSDNFGAILAAAQLASMNLAQNNQPPITMRAVLVAAIKAYEIQGVLALSNSFNQCGLDHAVLVRIASTAVATQLLGGNFEQVCAALSHAFADGAALRVYRHSPNTCARKSWAAGDACARALTLAQQSIAGDEGIKTVLSDPAWGFEKVLLGGKKLTLTRRFGSYVIENILFKVSFPAEFHGQTACEAAMALHSKAKMQLPQIEQVVVRTQSPALRIIDKTGPLTNASDRDHCIQYMVAVCLLFGEISTESYSDAFHHQHPEIDELRQKITLLLAPQYDLDYHNENKRAIGNSVQILYAAGRCSPTEELLYPLGHPRRRAEAKPLLLAKFNVALDQHIEVEVQRAQCEAVLAVEALTALEISSFMGLFGR